MEKHLKSPNLLNHPNILRRPRHQSILSHRNLPSHPNLQSPSEPPEPSESSEPHQFPEPPFLPNHMPALTNDNEKINLRASKISNVKKITWRRKSMSTSSKARTDITKASLKNEKSFYRAQPERAPMSEKLEFAVQSESAAISSTSSENSTLLNYF